MEVGSLSGGAVTKSVTLSPGDDFNVITFAASGVVDSGGGRECLQEQISMAVPPGEVQYRYTMIIPTSSFGATTVIEGVGATVDATMQFAGEYTCRFEAFVDRDCAPPDILVGEESESIELCSEYMPIASFPATGSQSVSFNGGQGMRVTVRNLNVLGVTARVSANGQSQQIIILPLQSHTFQFSIFGAEPLGWQVDFSSVSDAVVVFIEIESTWAPGCPQNG